MLWATVIIIRPTSSRPATPGPTPSPTPMADLSNNPFIDHTASVASRFPDINAVSPPSGPSSPQYSVGWQQQQQPSGFVGANPTGYTQQQYAQQPQWPSSSKQQQYHSQVQAQYPPASYQASSFGQQFVGQVDTLAAGYPQPHMQAQYTSYPTQQSEYGYQQPQQPSYGYPPQQQQQQQQQQHILAQFDPYANLGQFSPTTRASAPTASGIAGSPPPGVQHPRTFIHSHKTELEAWDPPTWRQVQNTFESLKVAWEARKRTAESQVRALGAAGASAGFFGGAQEINRLNALIKEAEANIDTIAAAALQMSEMFSGYRQSGDLASKRRVRESCNAAVSGLPDYPTAGIVMRTYREMGVVWEEFK
ncbi:hypothetical protein BJY52DRAFT_1211085 [Lactarius psammicola]|nr:hypothetical protein BJY52DRAFT_1211085 [Lactarius psammicola]